MINQIRNILPFAVSLSYITIALVRFACGRYSLCLSFYPPGCPKGFFGKNCERKCNCANSGRCHRVHGACVCEPGRYGRFVIWVSLRHWIFSVCEAGQLRKLLKILNVNLKKHPASELWTSVLIKVLLKTRAQETATQFWGNCSKEVREKPIYLHIFVSPLSLPGGSKNLPAMQEMQETRVPSPSRGDSLEEGMAIHSSIPAWRIPWTKEAGGHQSIGSQRIRHDKRWVHMRTLAAHTHLI